MTLVTLFGVTDTVTMRMSSFGGNSAVKHKSIPAALLCVLALFASLGCGTSNKLESIQISSSNTAEVDTGTVSIGINGPVAGPIQLYVWGNYSSGKTKLLTSSLGWNMVVNPDSPDAVDPSDNSLYPLAPLPNTLELSTTGLLTAINPSACTWLNSNYGNTKASGAAWSMVGNYMVTATYGSLTTPPVFVAMASAPGAADEKTNPTGACGPSATN